MNELIPYRDMQSMADVLGKSGMFGKNPQQLLALMLIAQAEGLHPARAAQEYDIIQGKPALKSQAALARFQDAGGKIEWKVRSDEVCEAVFSHPSASPVAVRWDMARAAKMGLATKDNWKKQPMIMLQWRVVAEGVRACYPACLNRMYLVEEVQDFDQPKDVTPVVEDAEPEKPGHRERTDNEREFANLCAQLTEEKAAEYYADLKAETTPEGKTRVLNDLREFVRSIDRTPAQKLEDDPGLDAAFDGEKPVIDPELF